MGMAIAKAYNIIVGNLADERWRRWVELVVSGG
jgi:hypothetical protein